MTFIVLSYIVWTSPAHGGPLGFGLELNVSYIVAAVLTALAALFVGVKAVKLKAENPDMLGCED